ncbi:hypothetical protein [Vibrio sp. YIC-376]|uniref:hypothetical protein n=1 Tax=Vibrio sp. YIC-376 TaxID=3136162 RepID=UPI00402A829F
MGRKLIIILAFTLTVFLPLSVTGAITSYLTFSPNSGWREGFALIAAIYAGGLAILSGVVFAVSCLFFCPQLQIKSAMTQGAIAVIFSAVLSIFVYQVGLPWSTSIGLFCISLVISSFCAPLVSVK